MFPLGLPRLFPTVHCDGGAEDQSHPDHKKLSTAISAVKGAISVQESELKRWKRIFDTHARLGDDGEKYVSLSLSHPFSRRSLALTPSHFSLHDGNSCRLKFLKVLGHRIIRQGYRSCRGFDENRSTPVRCIVPCRGYLQAWPCVLGRLCGVRDVAEEA